MPWIVRSFLLFTFLLNLVTAEDQCRSEVNIPGMALKGFVFKRMQATAPHKCDDKCAREITCQSYNYNIQEKICELNNRTKEARPQNFHADPAWFYIRRLIDRAPLGSIPELPALSCQEIKASEGSDTISNRYWLDPNDTGKSFLVYCDMNLEDAGSSFQLSFQDKSVSDYVRFDLKSNASPLSAFTVCLWLRSSLLGGGCVFSYSLPGEANEILMCDYSQSFMFMINSDRRDIDTTESDDQFNHICVTWETVAGSWNFYINGSLVKSDDNFETGHVIANNGIFILGQDQDSYGGGFEQEQSFLGQLYGVNMWNRELTAEEITHMSTNCSYMGVGNHLKWSHFMTGLHGNVSLTSPVTCKP